jgi:hypothetical protein
MAATRSAIGVDGANSWLPFTGRDDLKRPSPITASGGEGLGTTVAARS